MPKGSSPSWEHLGAGSSCAAPVMRCLPGFGSLPGGQGCASLPGGSSELGCSWCHLWLWCHLQIQSLSWGEGMESHGWDLLVQKGAPLALFSPWIFGLSGMEPWLYKASSKPRGLDLTDHDGIVPTAQCQHLPCVLPPSHLCRSGTQGWPPALSLQLPRAEHGPWEGFRLWARCCP